LPTIHQQKEDLMKEDFIYNTHAYGAYD